jgi:hypothetical protein
VVTEEATIEEEVTITKAVIGRKVVMRLKKSKLVVTMIVRSE